MKKTPFSFLTLALLAGVYAQEPIKITELDRKEPVDFGKEIFPLFKKNCIACHNSSKAKGQLNLEDPKAILKGGSEGPAMVVGKPDESFLLQVAAHLEDPIMPPEKNKANAVPFNSDELGLIKRWIEEGGKGEAPLVTVTPEHWVLSKRQDYPVYHMALSEDDHFVAASRGQRVHLYDLRWGKELGQLTDPALASQAIYEQETLAHQDFVQSIAFSADGWIATGGFRNAKLWKPTEQKGEPWHVFPEAVAALALSLEGDFMASASADGKVHVLKTASQESVRSFDMAEGVKALLLLPNQLLVATASGKLLTAAFDQDELAPMPGHDSAVEALARHPSQAHQIFSGGSDGAIKHWDLMTEKVIRTISHGEPVVSLSVSPDGKHLLSISANQAKVWKLEDGSHVRDLEVTPERTVNQERLKRSEKTNQVLLENRKKKLGEREKAWKDEVEKAKKAASDRLAAKAKWDESDLAAHQAQLTHRKSKSELDAAHAEVASLKQTMEKQEAEAKKGLSDSASEVRALFAQCETALGNQKTIKEKAQLALASLKEASALSEGDLLAADAILQTQNLLADAQHKLSMLEIEFVEAKQAALALDALEKANEVFQETKKRFMKSEDRAKQLTESHKKIEEAFTKAKESLEEASKANSQALENEELAVRLSQRAAEAQTRAQTALTVAEAKLKQSQEAIEAAAKIEASPLTSVAYSADGKTLALGRAEAGVLLYAVDDGRLLGSLEDPGTSQVLASPDGHWLTVHEKSVFKWKVTSGWEWTQTIGAIDDPTGLIDRVTALAFSPNGTVLATGSGSPSRSGELKFWRVADGSLLLEVEDAHSDTIVGVEFSPDGRYIATASTDRFSKVFQVSDGSLVAAFEGHTSHVLDVSWRADGLVLATAGADNVVKLWDFEEKRQIKTIDGYNQEITSVAFTDNAETLVTSSGDKTVRLGKERLDGKEFVYASALSQDGQWVVAGTQDSVVRVWQAKDKKLVQEFAAPAD